MNFDLAFARIVPLEGHYSPGDGVLGSENKFGLRKKDFPAEDIQSLTREKARPLYFTGVWVPSGCPLVPAAARLHLFTAGCIAGPARARLTLQRSLGVKEDGDLGFLTQGAAARMSPTQIASHITAHLLLHLACHRDWAVEGQSWVRLVADNLLET